MGSGQLSMYCIVLSENGGRCVDAVKAMEKSRPISFICSGLFPESAHFNTVMRRRKETVWAANFIPRFAPIHKNLSWTEHACAAGSPNVYSRKKE